MVELYKNYEIDFQDLYVKTEQVRSIKFASDITVSKKNADGTIKEQWTAKTIENARNLIDEIINNINQGINITSSSFGDKVL